MRSIALWIARHGRSQPLNAQSLEVKDKLAMYSYVANWQVPRAKSAKIEKSCSSGDKLLNQALGSGALVAYGDDKVEVQSAEGAPHYSFWSAMSMAGVLELPNMRRRACVRNGNASPPGRPVGRVTPTHTLDSANTQVAAVNPRLHGSGRSAPNLG